ncbi:MAG: hypothetical protein EAZ19_17300 [Oscillatoriales cyanobacterium]|nr:MAG: hypothetical protein EAZ19_17300 [Oscillatoriales cyanobacterium]
MLTQMKYLAKVFVALLLAVTLALGGVQGRANAGPIPIPDISIDVNKTIDQIIGLISTSQDFALMIANQTPETLQRVGSYNYTSNWPLGDIDPLTASGQEWKENGLGYFSFASNYAIGNTGRNFQFGASWPPVVSRKINVCARNESGNKPAELCWDKMSNSNDKTVTNAGFQSTATLRKKGNTVLWFYQVK